LQAIFSRCAKPAGCIESLNTIQLKEECEVAEYAYTVIGKFKNSVSDDWFEIKEIAIGNTLKGVFCRRGEEFDMEGRFTQNQDRKVAAVIWDVKAGGNLYSGGFTNYDPDINTFVGSIISAPLDEQQIELLGFAWGDAWERVE
jgi:hypothetical protein